MQIKELKLLIKYNAIKELMAMKYNSGWCLVAIKSGETDQKTSKDCCLEVARGGIREFKNLDTLYRTVRDIDCMNITII